MNRPASDFPEFDQAYKTVLVKDPTDRFEQLAAEANFNVYHSDIWRGTGRKFAELIVQECADVVASRPYIDDGNWSHPSMMIKKHFGVEE